MKIKTWHWELLVVSTVLIAVTFFFANNLINWITTAAIIFTFQHAQIGDRLQERQKILDKPTVECYWKLNYFFGIKEVLWIVAFVLMGNYAAIVGSLMFCIYPLWRKYYRTKIKPITPTSRSQIILILSASKVVESVNERLKQGYKVIEMTVIRDYLYTVIMER